MNSINIPKEWKIEKLERVCKSIRSGGTPSRGNAEYFGGTIPWVKMTDLKTDYIFDTEEKLTPEGVKRSSAKIFPKDTVLIAMYTYDMGKTAILGVDAATNQAICGLECNKNLIPRFLYYFLKIQQDEIRKLGSGGAQPNINQGKVKNLEIPIPVIEIQEKIVQKLDYVIGQLEEKKKVIFKLQKNKAQAIERLIKNSKGFLFSSLLKSEKLEDVILGDLILDMKLGTNQKASYNSKGIPVLRMPNIQDGRIDYSDLKYSEFSKKDEPKYLLQKGDVLVNRTNSAELVGKSAVFEKDEKFAFASYIIRLRVDKTKINHQFLSSYLNSPLGRNYIEQVYIKTAGQANINSENLREMHILLPSIKSQEKILENLVNLNSSISKLEKQLEHLKQSEEQMKNHLEILVKNILITAFSGKLVN